LCAADKLAVCPLRITKLFANLSPRRRRLSPPILGLPTNNALRGWFLRHVQQPAKVVSGMARVCGSGGMVLVEDIYGSEHPARAAYQDRWEILRDSSHVRTLPLSELLHVFRDAGLETETVSTADDLCPETGAMDGHNEGV